jgi:hypothetical protein
MQWGHGHVVRDTMIENRLTRLPAQVLERQPIEIGIAFVKTAKDLPLGAVHCINQARELVLVNRDRLFNNNACDGVGRWRLFAGRARLIARQPFDVLCHEPRLPSPYHRLRFARSVHNLGRAAAVSRGEDNVGAKRASAARCDPTRLPQAEAIGACDVHNNFSSRVESLNCFA